jgi:hypothetical protein
MYLQRHIRQLKGFFGRLIDFFDLCTLQAKRINYPNRNLSADRQITQNMNRIFLI